MNILEKIVAHKKAEVKNDRDRYPVALLEESVFYESQTVSFREYLLRSDKQGIIAEIKRKSPSKGELHPGVDVEQLSVGYMQAGASALSVLTDREFFGGSNRDLEIARRFNFCPILRKDFIVDEYQIVEARSIGADVILLIAACLSPEQIKQFSATAKGLGLEILLEVHSLAELEASICPDVTAVGVNNRDLGTFEVSLDVSHNLASHIPNEFVKVSESGINSPEDIVALRKSGFQGFLIGERFMSRARPQQACARLIRDLEEVQNGNG